MQIHHRFAKNAVANLGRGSAAAVLAVLLPPVLARHMAPASYAVWVLVLQTAAYMGYLNFGLQTAVGRYVALANEVGESHQRNSIFSTAIAGLCGAAGIALFCLGVAVLAVHIIFPSVPMQLIAQMRWALLLVGFSMALDLPASACNGVFIGMSRFEIPAITTGGSRLLIAAGISIAAITGQSLIVMAGTMATINILSYAAQYLALRRVAPDVRFHPSLVLLSTARELYGYCLGLTVMSFSGLLVSGFDLLLVGHFDFAVVVPYAVSASVIALIAGLLYAVVGVIMPHAAALHARQKVHEMGELVISTTRISLLLLILTGFPVLIYAGPLLRLMIGQHYAASGAPLLAVLLVANIIRLVGAPYSIVLVAAGQQNYIKISPLAEGISNFAASLVLGYFFGGIGIALGTLIGSFFSVGAHFLYSMPRTRKAIAMSRKKLVLAGVLSPLLWTSPLVLAGTASLLGIAIGPAIFASVMLLAAGGAGILLTRSQAVSSRRLLMTD